MTDVEADMGSRDYFRDPALFENPYPYYAEMRSKCPVQREEFRDVFMVTGYDEALEIYSNPTIWSNCNTIAGPYFPVPLVGDDVSDLIEQHRDELVFSDQLPSFDPPKHTAQRGLLMRLITPKRMKENEEFMWGLADRHIDAFLAEGKCEFIADYASSFTLLVVADLLGVPESDFGIIQSRMGNHHPAEQPLGEQDHKPLEYLYDQFIEYIEDRRSNPQNDVMTGMATATFPDGTTPPVHDVALIAANLFAAGQETTVRLLVASLRMLGERPDLQDLLRRERHRIPAFVEEMLRLESPLQGSFRLARRATSVGGVDLPAGTTVYVSEGAANRDPKQFENPDEFDLDRPNGRQHLAFAHGIHTCAGAPLARAEGRVTLERFLDRTTDIRISESAHGPAGARHYDYIPTYLIQGISNLHLEFTPAS
jgi:cytochrome P450 family 150 subfamily A5